MNFRCRDDLCGFALLGLRMGVWNLGREAGPHGAHVGVVCVGPVVKQRAWPGGSGTECEEDGLDL